jgi:transcriptional regulator with XRE-family HTH domain
VSDALALAIARAIRAERSRVGLTQEQLGEHVGLHRATIGAIETMTRHVYAHELADICDALDVTLDELLAKAPKADRRKLGFDR